MEHSHTHLTAFPSPRELQHTSWVVNYYTWGQASWLIRIAHYGKMPLPLLSSHISCLKEAAFAFHFALLTGELVLPAWAPPIHLNQTGSLSCSCPRSKGFHLNGNWSTIPPLLLAHRTHSTALADPADIEATVLLERNRCILWTVSRQISWKRGFMPKLQNLRLKKQSISSPVRLMLSQAALSFQPSVSISFLCKYHLQPQTPAAQIPFSSNISELLVLHKSHRLAKGNRNLGTAVVLREM